MSDLTPAFFAPEFYLLGYKGNWLVMNGVRLSEDSSRLFVFYERCPDGSAS